MVMTLKEQIEALEEEKKNIKGRGSAKKKEAVQKQIDELKAQDEALSAEGGAEDYPSAPNEEVPGGMEKLSEADKRGIHKEDIPVKQPEFEKVVVNAGPDDVARYEKKGVLVGFDPARGKAIIRKK